VNLDRSLVQIKSHGQKVVKRAEAGEDIWLPLKHNPWLIKQLISEVTRSPNFEMPLPPAFPPARFPIVTKPKLKPRPVVTWEERAATCQGSSVLFSVGNSRKVNDSSAAVFRTQFGGSGNLSFSFHGTPEQALVQDEGSRTSSTSSADAFVYQTPKRPDPQMIAPTAVLAATALCQLSVGQQDKKSSSDGDQCRVNIVSP